MVVINLLNFVTWDVLKDNAKSKTQFLKRMEQEVLLTDVLPYIWGWTLGIALIILMQAYRLWRFGKKYPEIFKQETTIKDKQLCSQKNELQRQYHNQSMISISVIFVWIIGMVLICFSFDGNALTNQGWFILILAICIILWILSMIKRKPKS